MNIKQLFIDKVWGILECPQKSARNRRILNVYISYGYFLKYWHTIDSYECSRYFLVST